MVGAASKDPSFVGLTAQSLTIQPCELASLPSRQPPSLQAHYGFSVWRPLTFHEVLPDYDRRLGAKADEVQRCSAINVVAVVVPSSSIGCVAGLASF